MKRFLLCFLLLCGAGVGLAQEFYGITGNARRTAMGGVTTGVAGDAYATSGNASSVLFCHKSIQAAFNYTKFSGETMRQNRMMSFGVYGKVAPRHMIAAGGDFYIEPIWQYTGKRPGAQRYEVAYGYKASERFAFAITARFIRTYGHDKGGCTIWDYNSGGLDFSVSAQLPTKLLDGAAIAKLGAKLSTDLGDDYLYNNYLFGATLGCGLMLPFTDSHSLEVGVDAKYGLAGIWGHTIAGSIGAEYTLMQLLYFRIGGNVAHYTDKFVNFNTIGYGTIGVGVRFFHLQFDVAYSAGRRNAPMSNMVQFSVGLDF